MLGHKTYSFPNVNGPNIEVWEWLSNLGPTIEVCEWLSNFIHTFLGICLLIHVGSMLNHVSKRGSWLSLPDLQMSSISSHGNDVVLLKYSDLSTERVKQCNFGELARWASGVFSDLFKNKNNIFFFHWRRWFIYVLTVEILVAAT